MRPRWSKSHGAVRRAGWGKWRTCNLKDGDVGALGLFSAWLIRRLTLKMTCIHARVKLVFEKMQYVFKRRRRPHKAHTQYALTFVRWFHPRKQVERLLMLGNRTGEHVMGNQSPDLPWAILPSVLKRRQCLVPGSVYMFRVEVIQRPSEVGTVGPLC